MKLPVIYKNLKPDERKAVREKYIEIQNGNCYHCQEKLEGDPPKSILKMKVNKGWFPANFFKWPVHLHHDHDTGLTIGAVHCYCNAVLWQYYGE